MPQHGRRSAAAVDQPVQRYGGISVETALVLALIVLIVAGSVLAQALMPSQRVTETVVGDKKVRVTTVGKGGVLPGPIEPRAIPVVVVVPTVAPIVVAKPKKTKKPKPAATAVPVATADPGGGTSPLPGGGGTCTILILCKPGETPAPTTGPDEPVEPTTGPGPSTPATPAPKQQAGAPPVAP